jgi:hypothetical protein
MYGAPNPFSECIQPFAGGFVLFGLARKRDVARYEDSLRRAGWRTGDHLRSVRNQLLLHIVMDVNDMVAFLPEVNVRYVDEDGRH